MIEIMSSEKRERATSVLGGAAVTVASAVFLGCLVRYPLILSSH